MNERDDGIDRLFNSRFKKEKKDPSPISQPNFKKTKKQKLDVTNAEQKKKKAILHFYGHVNLLFVSPSLGKKKKEKKRQDTRD